jgi:hypothetical protein
VVLRDPVDNLKQEIGPIEISRLPSKFFKEFLAQSFV